MSSISINDSKQGKWRVVGHSLFTPSEIDSQKIAIAPDGTKYIFLKDFYDHIGKASVMYYNVKNSEWNMLGSALF
jgi:hypothetical protein